MMLVSRLKHLNRYFIWDLLVQDSLSSQMRQVPGFPVRVARAGEPLGTTRIYSSVYWLVKFVPAPSR